MYVILSNDVISFLYVRLRVHPLFLDYELLMLKKYQKVLYLSQQNLIDEPIFHEIMKRNETEKKAS